MGSSAVPGERPREPTMLARVGVLRALNGYGERVFDPSRKEPHSGMRKLKRDQ